MGESVEEFGPFRIYEQLGLGGMAVVHRAEMRSIEGFRKPVALKRLLPHLASTPDLVKAFVREAQLASHLHHDNIVQTFELGKVDSKYFIAMEYVPGPTLSQIMIHAQAVAGAIPIPVTLGILIQVCDALDYAHNRCDDQTGKPLRIVHRDVSPPNIIVSNTGIVKLFDFGIAKVQGSDSVSKTGIVIKGKFNYIAPEYLGGKLDVRADLFAVGVIAHELLTGRRLFDGTDDFETAALVVEMPIQPPSRWASRVPRDLDDIVLTALQRDPDLRWRSASALRNALANVARGDNAVATNAQILEWVQWAFSQKSRPTDTRLDNVIDMLEQPSSVQTQLTREQHAELDAIVAVVAKPMTTLPGAGTAPPDKPKPRPAKPLNIKRAAAAAASGRPSAVVAVPITDEKSGVTVVGPAPRRGWGRIITYLLMIVVAACGGVVAASYYFELDLLPF